MISNQVLQNTLEGLKEISRTEFCIIDTDGKTLASTYSDFEIQPQDVQAFVESQAASQLVKGYQYFKVCDDYQLEYILVAHGEDEDTYLIDYVVDETSLNGGEFVNEIDKIEQENTVKLAMSKLKPRHQIILQQRLGLIDGEEKTLEEVGNIFGISRERVRQLEAKALNELRKPKNAKELKRIEN